MVNEVLLSAPLAVTIVISLSLGTYVGIKSKLRTKRLFVLMILEVGFLAATFWLELLSGTLEEKMFWNDLEYIVNVSIPPLFLLFNLRFLGMNTLTSRRNLFLLFLIPIISLLLVWTNDYHHLFYSQVVLENGTRFTTFVPVYNIGFVVHSAYSLFLLVISVALLLIAYLRSSNMHRKQIRLVLIAAVIPVFSLFIGLPLEFELSLTYFFVVGFITAGSLIFIGTFMYELFDVVPLALETVVDTMVDGIVVIDNADRIVFANAALLNKAGKKGPEAYAHPIDAIVPGLSNVKLEEAMNGQRVEVSLGEDGDKRIYRLNVTRLINKEGSVTSLLLSLRDITEEKQTSDSLKVANIKLNLLSSITRHDILNQVTVIHGYGELMLSGQLKDDAIKRYGEKINSAAEHIEQQFNFAVDYQGLGVRPPEWQKVGIIFDRARSLGLAGDLRTEAQLEGVEVLADPLLDRVFTILLDNSRRHSVNARTIKVGYTIQGDILIIIYEDDGIGIPPPEKERIFERGHGADSGLGLYLARQILDVTGMTIHENGTLNSGARFEIAVPRDRWRFAKVP